jgi:inositol-phosphate phosphatase/L-galactose 1-phosphate phosphatase
MECGYHRDPVTVAKLTGAMSGIMAKGVRSLRMAGATGLNMTAIACGKTDCYFEEGSWERNSGPKIWDFAGGKLIVEEAGGVVLDPSGELFSLMGRSALAAATKELADEVVAVLKARV